MKRLFKLTIFLSFILIGILNAEEKPKPIVYLLNIDGAIGPATADYFLDGIEKAQKENAELLILKLDTPGGLDSSMRKINKAILSSSVPVATFVYPDGARAASAGTYMLYASHIAAMAPATNLGAATPVSIGGGGLPGLDDKGKEKDKDSKNKKGKDKEEAAKTNKDALSKKALNDARAYIRGLAQKRKRNVEWAEQAVVQAKSLSAEEALKINVIDLIATDVSDLLKKLNGRKIPVLDQEQTLKTSSVEIKAYKPGWRNRLLQVISDPNIAYILLMIGIYGLIFEFMNPGFFVPGVAGAICLLLGFYALQVLPINYAGAALLLLGIALMTAEAFVPSFGILGIGGIAAFVMGSLMLIDVKGVPGFEISRSLIATITLVSAAFFFLIITMAVKARQRRVVSGAEEMLGAEGEVLEDFEGKGKVFVRSETWDAESDSPLKKGDAIKVVERNGLVLKVEKKG